MTEGRSAGGGLRSAELVGGDLHLVLNNTLAAIEDGRRELLKFFEQHALPVLAVNRLEVIFEEIVSNAIRHGFTPRSDQSMHVRARAKPGAFEFTFEDDGDPFDPRDAVESPAFTTLEAARIGGLGLPLVARLSSGLSYEREDPRNIRRAVTDFQPVNRTIITVSTT